MTHATGGIGTSAATQGPTLDAVFLVTHSDPGGVQEVWANLAAAFESRGLRATLAALYPPAGDASGPANAPFDWSYIVMRKPTSLFEAIALFVALVRFIRRQKPAVIFTGLPAAAVLVPLAATMSGRRVAVVIVHHSPTDTHARGLRLMDSMTGRLPAVRAIVAVSDAVRTSLGDRPRSYRLKVRVIRNALPPSLELHLERLARRRSGRVPRREVIAVGRLALEKNLSTLVQAIARLDDVRLTLVGAGPEEQRLRDLARERGLAERVRFTGLLSRKEALALMADSDIFVQPSLYEGHSLALIEAARIGLPLIVSDVPSQREGLTDDRNERCGIVVGAQDDATLAAEIGRMFDDADHRSFWIERSRRLGESIHFERTLSAYEALARDCARAAAPDHGAASAP